VAYTAAANAPSRQVMAKLGMSHDPAEDFDHFMYAPGRPAPMVRGLPALRGRLPAHRAA
jgi:RimJ/RimL family protein N-acetyltransferase